MASWGRHPAPPRGRPHTLMQGAWWAHCASGACPASGEPQAATGLLGLLGGRHAPRCPRLGLIQGPQPLASNSFPGFPAGPWTDPCVSRSLPARDPGGRRPPRVLPFLLLQGLPRFHICSVRSEKKEEKEPSQVGLWSWAGNGLAQGPSASHDWWFGSDHLLWGILCPAACVKASLASMPWGQEHAPALHPA